MIGNNPDENFLGGNFLAGFSKEEFDGCEFLEWQSPGGIFIEPSSSYKASILIFQKVLSKYNLTFNKKIYTLNS